MKKLGIIVGSLRKDSFNKTVAHYLADQLKSNFEVSFIEIGDLALYNEDLENDVPKAWERFRNEVDSMDAFLFVTPEYNRSLPAVIKNALDIGSRPFPQNLWAKKPAALITASPGAIGGFGAGQHFRNVASFLDIRLMSQPEAYLGNIADSIDENGKLISERTAGFLDKIAASFVKWSKIF